MNKRGGWLPWAALLSATAVAGWLVAPSPDPGATVVSPRRDTWRVPVVPQPVDQTALAATVMAAPYWGALPAAAASAPAEDLRWRVAAVYGKGDQREAVLEYLAATRPPVRVRAGDKLPDGRKIVRISDGELHVERGKEGIRLGVEQSGQ